MDQAPADDRTDPTDAELDAVNPDTLPQDHHRDLHFWGNTADGKPITEVEYRLAGTKRLIAPFVSMEAPAGFVAPRRITRNELMQMAA